MEMSLKNVKFVKASSGTEKGKVTGYQNCPMAGCTGIRVCVTWPDGKRTRPCTKGMRFVSKTIMRIVS